MLFTTTRPHADRHSFISAGRLQCLPFTLTLWNNRYERIPAGGLSQHFQLCSPKYRFIYKAPWKCRPDQIILIGLQTTPPHLLPVTEPTSALHATSPRGYLSHDGGARRPTQAGSRLAWLSTMNDDITKATSDHKRRQRREFIESIDHRTDSTKLWRRIKGIDGKSKQTAEIDGITFTGRFHTSLKMIANSFNRQFTTFKLGKHSSSRTTRHVLKYVKRMSYRRQNRSPATRSSVRSRNVGVAEHTTLTLSAPST